MPQKQVGAEKFVLVTEAELRELTEENKKLKRQLLQPGYNQSSNISTTALPTLKFREETLATSTVSAEDPLQQIVDLAGRNMKQKARLFIAWLRANHALIDPNDLSMAYSDGSKSSHLFDLFRWLALNDHLTTRSKKPWDLGKFIDESKKWPSKVPLTMLGSKKDKLFTRKVTYRRENKQRQRKPIKRRGTVRPR